MKRDFSVLVDAVEKKKTEPNYRYTAQIMDQSQKISKEIEKLKEIVCNSNNYNYSIITTT